MDINKRSHEHMNDALELIDTAHSALLRLQMLEPSSACASALYVLSDERDRLQRAVAAAPPVMSACVVRGAPLFDV